MESTRFKLAFFLGLALLLFVVRSSRKGDLDGNNFMDVALASASVVLAVSLVLKVFQEEVVKLLKEDTISLLIGAGAQIIVSINQEIKADSNFVYNKMKSLVIKAFTFKKTP